MKKIKIRGKLVGVTFGENAPQKWRIRLTADCEVGKEDEIISVSKATVMGSEVEVEI